MANPVNNSGINAQVSVGGALDVDAKIGAPARVSENQSKGIFQNVNENYTRNPNNSPTVQQAGNEAEAGDHTAPPANLKNPDIGEDATLLKAAARGENGEANPSNQGILNGRGHHKTEVQGQTIETPPIVILPTETKGTQPTIETPPIVLLPNRHDNGNLNGHRSNPLIFTNIDWQNNQTNMGVNYSVDLNLRANGNQPYGVIRQVVSQVLRQADVYLSNNAINRLISNQTFQSSTRTFSQNPNLPREVGNLIQTIGSRVLSLLDNSHQNHKLIHRISKEIARELRENIQTARHEILKNADLGAVHFKHLNIKEKMHVAVSMLPEHLPAKALEHLQNHKAQDVLKGLLLARGLIVPNENSAEIRNLVAFKSSVLPPAISMTALRDVGQLVKTLIADTAAAKTTANLDLAVQKFVKILLANNELGVLMATVSLAAQAPGQAGLIARSLALAQIYELINQLIQAGEKALREAAGEKNVLQKERNIFQPVGLSAFEELDESQIQPSRLKANEAVVSLRQFLEFNPAFFYDNSASVFNNPDDARQAQRDFINLYHDDIAGWLESGKHRFVKDFDFDKPVGVVIERDSDRTFTANTARFVLVRDGSVQGWHFLKSFLVK